MRDYSKVSSGFWTGKTGRSLRGDMQTQIVAMYLMTSPHSNMIGVFHCPILYIAHETGSPLEGATEGLKKLIEGGFCTYEDDSETIWVHQMANFQIGEELKPTDNRVKDIRKQFENLPEGRIKTEFFKKYGKAFHLENTKPLASPSVAPSKPEAGAGTEAGDSGAPSAGEGAPNDPPPSPTVAGLICKAIKAEGIGSVSPSNPKFLELIQAGATLEMFVDVAILAKERNAPNFGYVLKTVSGQLDDARKSPPRQRDSQQPAPVDF